MVEESNSLLKIKEENWIEISVVYDIFIFLLNSSSSIATSSQVIPYSRLNRFFTKRFLASLFLNINSSDLDERLLVKLVTYKLYAGNLEIRKIILEVLDEYLIELVSNQDSLLNNGVIDCFDIFSKLVCL